MTGELANLLQSYNKAEKVADRPYVDRICSLVVHSKNIEKYLNNVMVVDNSFFFFFYNFNNIIYFLNIFIFSMRHIF